MNNSTNTEPATAAACRRCIIMRGLPGSGKSTRARQHVAAAAGAGSTVCSADDYFVALGGGKYRFDPRQLGAASHGWWSHFDAPHYDIILYGELPTKYNGTSKRLYHPG